MLPSIVAPTSPAVFRRYLKAAKMASSVTSTAKNRQVSRINENSGIHISREIGGLLWKKWKR